MKPRELRWFDSDYPHHIFPECRIDLHSFGEYNNQFIFVRDFICAIGETGYHLTLRKLGYRFESCIAYQNIAKVVLEKTSVKEIEGVSPSLRSKFKKFKGSSSVT